MRKLIAIAALMTVAAMSAVAQGRGRGHAAPISNPGSLHSNAPAGTPAASSDRDTGKERAEDVGKGKEKGLKKHKNKRQDSNKK